MRVGWISIGNGIYGSTRIAVANNHKEMHRQGLFSKILHYNKDFNGDILGDIELIKSDISKSRIDTVIFHKVFLQKAQSLAKWCKENKIKVIYTAGDWTENPMFSISDTIIVGSEYMAQAIAKKYSLSKVFSVEDGIETKSFGLKVHEDKKDLTLGWFGNFQKLDYSVDFINSLNLSNFSLYTISNAPCPYTRSKASFTMGALTPRAWDIKTLVSILLDKVDICVIPIEESITEDDKLKNFAKTANRLTLSMSLAIPVVASSIPAYTNVIDNGKNSFLCKSKNEWEVSLDKLRDYNLRQEIGYTASEFVRKEFSQEKITKKWIELLER